MASPASGARSPVSVHATIASASSTSSGSFSPSASSANRSQVSDSWRPSLSAQNHSSRVAVRSASPPSPVSPRKRIAARTFSRSARRRASHTSCSSPRRWRSALLDEVREVPGVPRAQPRQLACAVGLLLGVFADRLEHAPARLRPRPRRAASDRSTSAQSRSKTSSASTPSPAQTSSTAARVAPGGKTDRRRASRRSGSLSRSQLQSTTARSVRWRPAAARLPPVRRRKRSCRRSASCSSGIERSRAAASSMARGRPSIRRQTSATAGLVASSSEKSGDADVARSANSRTAASSSRGPTGESASPSIASGSRLVARMRRPGQAARRRSASRAAGPTMCSQLSSTTSASVPASASSRR